MYNSAISGPNNFEEGMRIRSSSFQLNGQSGKKEDLNGGTYGKIDESSIARLACNFLVFF